MIKAKGKRDRIFRPAAVFACISGMQRQPLRQIYAGAAMVFLLLILPVFTSGCAYNSAKNSVAIKELLTSFKYKMFGIDRLIKDNNLDIAKVYLKEMINEGVHPLFANLHLAIIYTMQGKRKKCAKYLKASKSLINSKQDKAEYLFYKIKINLINRQKGYFDSSMKIISKLKREGANRERLYYYKGLLFFYHGDSLNALRCFKIVAKLNSSYKRRAKDAINKI